MSAPEPSLPVGLDHAAVFFAGAGVPIAHAAQSGEMTLWNTAWARLLGEPSAEPWQWLDAIVGPSRERLRREFVQAVSHGRPEEIEVSGRTSTGSLCELVFAVTPVERGAGGALMIAWDITERRRNEERLAFMAGHDALTGLANRRAFDEALNRAVNRAQRGTAAHVLIFDVDRLKALNDSRGHLAGDQALVNAAMLIRRHVRAMDLSARIGGDEFAVLLEDATADEAHSTGERILRAAFEDGFVVGGRELGLGLSCGQTTISAGDDARNVVERADAALYAAKTSGRNRVVVWSPDVAGSLEPERIVTSVHNAFAGDGFSLVYQPVVRLDDESVAYYESLLRMDGAEGRHHVPGEFLPVVERLGLMPRLTRRVVDLVLLQLAAVTGADVSVNVSGSDLADSELLGDIAQAVQASHPARGRLIFEMSESALLSNLAAGRDWMETLAPLGCRFVLDDFGTGTGVFVLLREPHIEQVKLSGTITRALSGEDGRHAFVLALRSLIESQGKATVATYVETERLLGEAREAGFELGQGFEVGEPESDLAALVRRVAR